MLVQILFILVVGTRSYLSTQHNSLDSNVKRRNPQQERAVSRKCTFSLSVKWRERQVQWLAWFDRIIQKHKCATWWNNANKVAFKFLVGFVFIGREKEGRPEQPNNSSFMRHSVLNSLTDIFPSLSLAKVRLPCYYKSNMRHGHLLQSAIIISNLVHRHPIEKSRHPHTSWNWFAHGKRNHCFCFKWTD